MPRKRLRPTMKDVARLAGVSVQTVSVVINNKPDIAPDTRERILSAIDKLGYRPLAIARSLRTGSTRSIALVVSDITNPFFAKMASTVEDYAHRSGYNLILYNTHSDLEREKKYMESATQRWIDGLLFVSTQDSMGGLDTLRAAGIPTVAVDRIPDHYDGPSVILDNLSTGRLVAEHLLELGHRHFAHISGPLDLRLSRERLESFQNAIAARGIDPGIYAVGDDSWSCESGYHAMRTLLDARPRPRAVFASNDRLAIGAMRAILEAGLRIPDDVSVVGVDDIEFAAYQTPPLTTVRQSLTDVATLGIKILLGILRGETPAQTQAVFEPMLVVRQSTASPVMGKEG
ncbi:MAG: LacI family DNA-binding transcriptional regulator [Anaerolineae bacterium]|nr:LacI family DNA-binding transcriptional regulator [Anaerolineae bacterium]